MVSMNWLTATALEIAGKKDIPLKHIPGPEGVRGRNSDNTLIQQVLKWKPGTKLRDGLEKTYEWLKVQVDKYIADGGSAESLRTSTVVKMQDIPELGTFRVK